MKDYNISNELSLLSNEIITIIEHENKEYDFKKNKYYVERNVPASKFKSKKRRY